MSGFVTRALEGKTIRLDPAGPDDAIELGDLDWVRSLQPGMGGWFARSSVSPGTLALRAIHGGPIVGAIEARGLPGYPGVANVSMYTDPALARPGRILEAYALLVDDLFAQGVDLVHHEVLEMNRPIHRILVGIGVRPTARLRQHAFVAGRFWDVLVYAYDQKHWEHVLTKVAPRNPVRSLAP